MRSFGERINPHPRASVRRDEPMAAMDEQVAADRLSGRVGGLPGQDAVTDESAGSVLVGTTSKVSVPLVM